MAPRNVTTGRQRRLASEIRRMRERAGISIHEAAAMLGADRTMISNIEAARTGVSEDRVHQLAGHYRCTDEEFVRALAAMAAGARKVPHWWDEYRGKIPDWSLDVSELEHHAARIRTAHGMHLPGLFQTEEHARALLDLVVPELPRLEVELRVAHRLGRRQVLDREPPVPYLGILHEAALRMRFGGREVARAQLHRLADAADRPHVTLRVIPFSAGSFPGAGQSVLYAEGPVPQLDTVQLDTAYGAHFASAPEPLADYRALLDLMERSALPPAESQQLIRSAAREL